MSIKSIPEDIEKLRQSWFFHYREWRGYHYALGVVGTICAITVASNPKFFQDIPYILEGAAWISAICIALLTFLMPSRRAKAYIDAWRILNNSCNRYKMSEDYTVEQLLDAVASGENTIATSDPP